MLVCVQDRNTQIIYYIVLPRTQALRGNEAECVSLGKAVGAHITESSVCMDRQGNSLKIASLLYSYGSLRCPHDWNPPPSCKIHTV